MIDNYSYVTIGQIITVGLAGNIRKFWFSSKNYGSTMIKAANISFIEKQVFDYQVLALDVSEIDALDIVLEDSDYENLARFCNLI